MLHICFPSNQILVSSKNFPNCVNNKNCIRVHIITVLYLLSYTIRKSWVWWGLGDWKGEGVGGKQRIGFVYQLRYFVASYLPVATCRDIIKNSKVGTARVGTKLHIHIFIFYTYILSWTNSENFVVVTFLRKLKKTAAIFAKKYRNKSFGANPRG